MTTVLVLLGAVAMTGAAAAAPFLLPWPQRLRWIVATASMPDPFGFAVVPASMYFEDVTVQAIEPCAAGVFVRLASRARGELVELLPATAADILRLQRWAAARTPLLLVASANGHSLHSPTASVTGLAPAPHVLPMAV